jgi:hypothetical protein
MSFGVVSSIGAPIRTQTQHSRSSDDGGGGDMNARVTALEVTVRHIDGQLTDIKGDIRDLRTETGKLHSDNRQNILLGVAAIAFLLGAIAFAYFRLTDQVGSLTGKISDMQLSIQRIADAASDPRLRLRDPQSSPETKRDPTPPLP